MGLRTKTKLFFLRTLTKKQVAEQHALWESLYGQFDRTDYEKFFVSGLPSESGVYHGEIIKWAMDIHPQRVLFAGENKETAEQLKQIIKADFVFTTGLGGTDFEWDFEKEPPAIEENFDLVVSRAILEHLLNPFKHVLDLSSLLQESGYLILHTVMPGFPYHRHPIDSVRFFPDWFEEVAQRMKLEIVKKKISDTHIFYMYQKPGKQPF